MLVTAITPQQGSSSFQQEASMPNSSGHQCPPPGAQRRVWGSSHPCEADGQCAGTSYPLRTFAQESEGLNTWGFFRLLSMNRSPSGSLI